MVELLFGSTYLTIISALIPEIGFYGGAALIIRHVVRRQHRGWLSVLLLGMAFAVFEEFLVVQTSVSPALFVGPSSPHIYGQILGVNLVYFMWAVGYESVWGIVLPIYLTELIFPNRREDQWPGRRGLSTTVTVFILASVVSWYIYTQVVAPLATGSIYSPPTSLIVFALATIAALGMVALGPRPARHPFQRRARVAPRPWLVGSLVFVPSLLWFVLVAFAFSEFPTVPAAVPIAAGLVLATGVLFLVRALSAGTGWQDIHRLAVIFGGLAASMLAGFLASGIVLPIDLIGKTVFDVVAVIMLVYLARKLRDRSRKGAAGSAPSQAVRSGNEGFSFFRRPCDL
jgi:hypothetical protein